MVEMYEINLKLGSSYLYELMPVKDSGYSLIGDILIQTKYKQQQNDFNSKSTLISHFMSGNSFVSLCYRQF